MASSIEFAKFKGSLKILKEKAIEQNRRKQAYEEKIAIMTEKVEEAKLYKTCIENILNLLEKYSIEYQNSRLYQINVETEKALNIAMPEENFKFKIAIDEQGSKAEFLIGSIKDDGKIKWTLPVESNGGYVQQLTFMSAIVTIIMLEGYSICWGDEWLNAGDDKRLKDTATILKKVCQNVQVLTIEHNDSIFTQIPNRQILLRKRAKGRSAFKGLTELVSIVDYDPKEEYTDINSSIMDGNTFLQNSDRYESKVINV